MDGNAGYVPAMAELGSEQGEPSQLGDTAPAERAAVLATEVSESRRPDRRRIAAGMGEIARSGARATGRGVRATGRGVRAARRSMQFGVGWLSNQVIAMAPRLKVRDQAALRAQFPGMPVEDIADALVEGAARASGAVGGAVGAWAALPALPAFPAEIAAETLALIGIELKLVAELHEIYGMPAPGNVTERTTVYLASWAHRRGITTTPTGLLLAAGSPLARRLQRRIAGRAGRTVFSLGPLFTGAAAGAYLNHHETHRLGREVRSDLRRRALGHIPDGE